MVNCRYLMLTVALAAHSAGTQADGVIDSVYSAQIHRRNSRLQARGDIADLLDKNPNIKALVADYSDLIEPLIQRDVDDLSVRDIEQVDLAKLRLRSILRRVAEARAEAEAEADADAGAESEAELVERDADPEADAEANIWGSVFGTTMNDATAKNNKRNTEAQPAYEPQGNIWARMWKTGSDLLSGVNGITRRLARPNQKRDVDIETIIVAREAEAEAEADAEPSEFGSSTDSLKNLFTRGFDFIGEYSGVGVGNHRTKRDSTAAAQPEAAFDQDVFERSSDFEA